MSVFLGIYAPITSATPNILCVYKRLETVQVKIRFRAPKKQCTFAQFVHLSGVSTSCGSDGNCELLMASLSCFMRSDFLVMCDLRETARLNFVSFLVFLMPIELPAPYDSACQYRLPRG